MAEINISQVFELALKHHQSGQLEQADQLYQVVLAREPNHADATHNLGVIALQIGQLEVAIPLIRRAITLAPSLASAYSNLGNALVGLGQVDEAVDAYRNSLRLQPNNPDALSNLGVALRSRRHFAEATQCLRQAVALRPEHADAWYNLALCCFDQARYDDSMQACRRAISLRPDYPEAYNNLGLALMRCGSPKDAAAHFEKSITLRPQFGLAHYNLATLKEGIGRLDEASDFYRQAIVLMPNHCESLTRLAVLLGRTGKPDDAFELFGRAVTTSPNNAWTYRCLGEFFGDQGRLEDAMTAFTHAVALDPNDAWALRGLSMVQCDLGRSAEAADTAARALELDPNNAPGHAALGNALMHLWKLDEAEVELRKAIELDRRWMSSRCALIGVLTLAGKMNQTIAAARQALEIDPLHAVMRSSLIFAMHYDPESSPQDIAVEQAVWNRLHAAPTLPPASNDPAADRRLRIGYVSGDLKVHPVAHNLLPLFRNHHHGDFEIFGYSNLNCSDYMTRQYRTLCDHWREIYGLPDDAVERLVRHDEIDILVDLSLHTGGNRLTVFKRKPAPVQCTFAGYPASTGLEEIDYRLSDPYLDPAGLYERFCSERIVRLPDSFWCFDPMDGTEIPVAATPALENGYLTFGCLNNFSKVNAKVIELWSKVLKRVPGSRMLVMVPIGSPRRWIEEQFVQHGVEINRIEFVARLARNQYLKLYNRIDIGLDTFPYAGHTTSLDSLFMGVVVVTLVGQTPVSRAGWSQLSNLKLTDFAAENADRFVQIAVNAAGDLNRLQELRSSLRQRMADSPLMDAKKFASSIERVYRTIWREWCAKPHDQPVASSVCSR